ncbi:hypothetical protein RR48_04755 [Papilio machaon]|uniref:Uncharacterized protein n=1 Tax=Papilio machaon TaxID=76193 RepID=A0A0N1IHR2_PAPMA|nr:hypothetical protein RR48_04755 [Papilio machaon]
MAKMDCRGSFGHTKWRSVISAYPSGFTGAMTRQKRRSRRNAQGAPAKAARLVLGRVPVGVMLPPRYATLPLPAPYAAPPAHPAHRPRQTHSITPRDSLTRSLERIHRKRRADRDRPSDADLKRTYTGLDRAYAEQFIAVRDESRHAAERLDSLASTDTSDTAHDRDTHRDPHRDH